MKAEGEGEKGWKLELVSRPENLALGGGPEFQPHFSLWREAATVSTFDCPAENGYMCGCFFFFFLI